MKLPKAKPWTDARVAGVARAAAKLAYQHCAKIAAEPYSDEVQVLFGDEPAVVGRKIAKAIQRAGRRVP